MEATDAYLQYVQTRRENDLIPKNATLTLPEDDMASIGGMIANALEEHGPQLSVPAKRRWLSILRSVQRAVEGAA